jgi:hypothetical protein
MVPSSSSALEATLAETLTTDNPPEYLHWGATPAIRARAGDKEEILAIVGDAYWAIQASGPDSHAMLDDLLSSASIAELNAHRVGGSTLKAGLKFR